MWAYYTCGPTIHVGLLYMWVYYTCGPSVIVGPQHMWAYNTCGPTVHVGLLQMRPDNELGPTELMDPRYMGALSGARNTCTVTIYVGKLHMWAHSTCAPTIHVAYNTYLVGTEGPQNLWAHNARAYYTCGPTLLTCGPRGPTIHVGILYMWAPNTCRLTKHVGLLFICAYYPNVL